MVDKDQKVLVDFSLLVKTISKIEANIIMYSIPILIFKTLA